MATTISPTQRIIQDPSQFKPRLLFLDDRTKRIEAALRIYGENYKLTIVTNVTEALRYLSREDWSFVSLDHDLNGNDFQDPDMPTCGMEVVRYLEKTSWPYWKPKPEWWVHSSNLFAANMMVLRLKALDMEAYYRPFVYEEVEHMKYDKDGLPI